MRAENGKNDLIHSTEFFRPDGKWAAVRDNLLDCRFYYAAVKDRQDDFYPPGRRTNLFGTIMPVAGALPGSGAVWLTGSNLAVQRLIPHLRKSYFTVATLAGLVAPGLLLLRFCYKQMLALLHCDFSKRIAFITKAAAFNTQQDIEIKQGRSSQELNLVALSACNAQAGG